jgi:IclR family acetate operon transcriptional repressor
MDSTTHAIKPPAYPIGSVDNALRLLLLFRHRKQVRIVDASAELSVARSTAHRLMEMLAYHGFVRQDPQSRAYTAGPALLDIGLSAANHIDVRALARPVLEQLREDTGETVHLAQLELPNVRFIDCVESERDVRVSSRVGRVMPAHCVSVGKAMLAALPSDVFTDYFRGRPLPRVTQHSITSRRELRRHLDEVQERGYAMNVEEGEDGSASIGVAIATQRGELLGALSVGAPLQRWRATDVDRLAALATGAADGIARAAAIR